MVRLMGLHLSGLELARRLALASLASVLSFFFLFYLPQNVTKFSEGSLLVTRSSVGAQVLASLVSPTEPTLGIFVVMLSFVGILLRGSRVYGPILIENGLAFLLYIYSFFQGGVYHFRATGEVFGVASANMTLSVHIAVLMFLFMVPASLTVVKGVQVIRESLRKS